MKETIYFLRQKLNMIKVNRTKNNFQDRFFEDVVPGIYKLLARENRTTKGFTSKSIRIVTNSSDG